MSVFGAAYSEAYDKLYSEKDYDGECNMIEALLALEGQGCRKRLLDLGCGTGNHAIPLALRGYAVTGVDFSEEMLSRARAKAAEAGIASRTSFLHGDVRTVKIFDDDGFDAAIMMFAVLGYQQTDDDVRAALRTARANISTGAPFVFDVWYGPGVISDKPGPRERIIGGLDERVVRRTNTVLDERRHLCTVKFDLEISRNGRPIEETHEDHTMRFFFSDELDRFAKECGFSLVTLRNFPDWRRTVTPSSWNAVGLLRAV